MKIEEWFDVKVCVLNSLDETPDSSCDLVEIEGKYPEFGFVRPRKISWRAYLDTVSDPYQIVKSEKLRKNLKKWVQQMQEVGVTVEVMDPLDNDMFQKWLHIYRSHLGQKERANMAIDETWLTEKQSKGKKVGGLFFYKGDQFLGGNLMVLEEKKLSVGFGIVEHMDEYGWNAGALLDFLTIQYGVEKGYKVISFGRDTNLYGLHLSAGLFSYKARLGLTPGPDEKKGYVTTKFLDFSKFMEPVVFMAEEKDEKYIQVLYNNDRPGEKEYMPKGIMTVKIQEKSEFV